MLEKDAKRQAKKDDKNSCLVVVPGAGAWKMANYDGSVATFGDVEWYISLYMRNFPPVPDDNMNLA